MKRYTTKNTDGTSSIAEADLQEAFNQFAKFEDTYEEFVESQKTYTCRT
ncbi:MAG: hypothetical protein LBM93_11720 [Oscillospiraceae bacterium]|jgi:hypothetical protein|nr:hypothetical protein [Oscillospiraceae bacterium]